jgi:hypothetical protein
MSQHVCSCCLFASCSCCLLLFHFVVSTCNTSRMLFVVVVVAVVVVVVVVIVVVVVVAVVLVAVVAVVPLLVLTMFRCSCIAVGCCLEIGGYVRILHALGVL